MDEFGYPPLEVEQATMIKANITDPIDIPWNTDTLFTRLTTPQSIRRREERVIKRLKRSGVFGEIPFMLRLQTSRHLLDREMPRLMQSSAPFYLSFEDCAEPPRSLPNEMAGFLDVPIQRARIRSLTEIDLDNLDTEIPMPNREETTSVPTEWQIYM